MCELLALARVPRTAGVAWLEAFHRRGGRLGPHADGWGIAAMSGSPRDGSSGAATGAAVPGPEVACYREASPASASAFAAVVRERLLGSAGDGPAPVAPDDVVLCHIRKATQGARALRNTQPFVRELAGRLHVFAHNGDLPGAPAALATHRCGPCHPVGDTDSEQLFCALLEALQHLWCAQAPGQVPPLGARLGFVESVATRARALGPANFLSADGDALFVHAHERTQPDGQVRPPGLLLRRLAQEGDAPRGLLVASVPFTAEGQREAPHAGEPLWEPLGRGEVIAIRRGRVADRRGGPAQPAEITP